VETGDILLHSVLAITHLSLPGTHKDGETRIYTPEEESRLLLQSNILGFVYISEVDDVKRKMVILSPTPGKLPPNFMLMGSLKWMDA
jgi:polyribonucleotide 5'-hydroxyl-kinase